eukprot:TRINITY_DN11317_c0_g3_i1.p1 TRINITY_DN11317_c0_g3~~TRINITY_DN11317_c0_g3_i1.p1  ORF type:complete len:691 (-),score=85.35 TRINITY_DN11317_c0_g3_i1:29-2101(-)
MPSPKRSSSLADVGIRCGLCICASVGVSCVYTVISPSLNLYLSVGLVLLAVVLSLIIPHVLLAIFVTLFFSSFAILVAGLEDVHHIEKLPAFHAQNITRFLSKKAIIAEARDEAFQLTHMHDEHRKGGIEALQTHMHDEHRKGGIEAPQHVDGQEEPRLDELMKRMRTALAPFQYQYLTHLGLLNSSSCEAKYSDEIKNSFIPGCPSAGCIAQATLEAAKAQCKQHEDCGGITRVGTRFELRSGQNARHSPNDEASWTRLPCPGSVVPERASGSNLWSAFAKVMDEALDDPSLHLNSTLRAPRADDSIYLSVSSYRDDSCPWTVRRAFERADHPERVNVGIVQINCESQTGCKWSTGWANTRRIIDRPGADVDCWKEFCSSKLGAPHCKAGRVRILRLTEALALGPFFTRYLNAKLWRGETFYMQIDAHIGFRSGWDTTIVDQMKRTPTYPMSIISSYPPDGSPKSTHAWPASKGPAHVPPEALCQCTFEASPGWNKVPRQTVRLQHSWREFNPSANGNDPKRPRQSAFVAAGFFIAHSSILQNVPFDPFLPFLFMGEEIALSFRFWTSGYDIYAPTDVIVNHDYGRHEAPKFWETVDMVFSRPGTYNEINHLMVQRVQHLVGMTEAATENDVTREVPSLLTRAEQFSAGKARSGKDFAKFMGIAWERHEQTPPSWCIHGETPPWAHATA